jgi:hypothetical protein
MHPVLRSLQLLGAETKGPVQKVRLCQPTDYEDSFIQQWPLAHKEGKLLRWKQQRSRKLTMEWIPLNPQIAPICTLQELQVIKLIFLYLSSAGDPARCSDHMGKVLLTELSHTQSRGGKLYPSPLSSAWTLRTLQLKDHRWLCATNDLNSDA